MSVTTTNSTVLLSDINFLKQYVKYPMIFLDFKPDYFIVLYYFF